MANSSNLKILMTADTIGGVWTYALGLCKSFGSMGIEVHLATMGQRLSKDQCNTAGGIENLSIYESNYKLEWMENPWQDVKDAGEWLLRLEKEISPDVIHLNNFVHGNLPWEAPVIVVAHSCVLSWWEAVKKESAPPEWEKYKKAVKAGLRAADLVVGISNSFAKEVGRLYGPFKKEVVIYNGCESSEFKVFEKKDQVFAMGRIWDEAKNLQILEKIAERSFYPIIIAGSSEDPSTGKRITLKGVRSLGQLSREKVKECLAESRIYVLPAKYEPFGLSALEAALSGCVLVLSDIPTLREVWKDTALYFNPENAETLLHQLEWISVNPGKSGDLSKKSFERALLFTQNKMSQKYLKLYNQLAAPVEVLEAFFNNN